jgi:outer membrane autotransporter protein
MIAGAMFTYLRNDGDFDAGGDFDTDSQGITLYASFVPSPATFFDLSAGFARKDHGVNRRANFVEFDNGGNTNTFDGIVNSDTDGEEISVGGSFGYDRSKGSFTYGPRFSLNWIQTRIDGYSEAGGGAGTVPVGGIRGAAGLALVYAEQEVDSLQSVVGFQGSVASSKGFGVLVFQSNADYVHEFSNSQRFVNVRFVQDFRPDPQTFRFQTERPVRDFFNVGVSLVAVFPNGVQTFVNLEAMIGNEQFDNYAATLGVRFEL